LKKRKQKPTALRKENAANVKKKWRGKITNGTSVEGNGTGKGLAKKNGVMEKKKPRKAGEESCKREGNSDLAGD